VPATGQFTTLYTFTGTSDGYEPVLAGVAANGNLYGATVFGGANGYGTLFELTPNGIGAAARHAATISGGYTYVHLYDFTGGADGANSSYPALLSGGVLVGGTDAGPITNPN
jgi:uncharacterized repeat protein (TIGR03803 family)